MSDSTQNTPDPSVPAPSWRRRALLGGGIAVGTIAAAGLWRAAAVGMIPGDYSPFEAWDRWETSPQGDPLSLVAAAILAASPHNTQPWLFHVRQDQIDVHADAGRSLGALDPFAREMWVGLGAAIANMEIASLARGFAASTELRPDPAKPSLAARIALRRSQAMPSNLAEVISRRRTHRGPYQPTREVQSEVLDALSKDDTDEVRVVWLSASSVHGRAFAQATLAGTQRIVNDPQMSADGHRWFRGNPRTVAMHKDGVSVPTAGIPPVVAAVSALLPPVDGKTSGEYWLRSTQRQLESAPMYALLVVRDVYDRRSQLLAGMRWQRIHLQLTRMGLAAQPLNQLVELVDRDRQLSRPSPSASLLQTMSGNAGAQAIFAFRLGYPQTVVPQSPRRPLEAVLAKDPAV